MPDPMNARKPYENLPGRQSIDLPKPPGGIRRALREHPKATDWSIVAAFLVLTVIVVVVSFLVPIDGLPEDELRVRWEYPGYLRFPRVLILILMVVVTAVALLVRRTYPLLSLGSVLLMSVLVPDDVLPSLALALAIALLLYTVPVYRSARAGWVGYLLANLATVPDSVISFQINNKSVFDDAGGVAAIATLALLMLVPVTLGINAGNRRRYTDAIIDRAHQLARERDQLARLAVAEERTRIAREMHDIIAHSVSVMVTLSEGAARAAEIQPAAAAEAMRQSAETGRSALTEMRRLIGALREPSEDGDGPVAGSGAGGSGSGAELTPMPGLDDLPDLIKGFRAAGLNVEYTLKGIAPAHGASGERGRDLAIYRTVQEALTNTLRYSGAGSEARVVIRQGGDGTTVSVIDDGGLPGNRPMTGLGSGQGLVGLAERLRVYGGRLEYGPVDSGGWFVTATLPADEGLDEGLGEGAMDVR
ncbi:MAG: histidine kinase [Ancrocorticia sp.]